MDRFPDRALNVELVGDKPVIIEARERGREIKSYKIRRIDQNFRAVGSIQKTVSTAADETLVSGWVSEDR